MSNFGFRSPWTALTAMAAVAALTAASPALAVQTFDTEAIGATAVQATYGLVAVGFLENSVSVSGGTLKVDVGPDGNMAFGTLAGDAVVQFDAFYNAPLYGAGALGLGVTVGDNHLLFHPGYPGGAFRIDGPGGFGNSDMGFTPSGTAWHHITLTVDASAQTLKFDMQDGANPANTFSYTFTDANYQPGVTLLGLRGNGGGVVEFDNLSITAVPEPGTWALALAGLAAIGGVAQRRRSA